MSEEFFGGPGWNADETVKPCPECGHPMMRGPLRSKGRIVAWWCANCHHAIAPPCQCEHPDAEARLDPGRKHCPVHGEEAALAREDARRVTAASEGEEA